MSAETKIPKIQINATLMPVEVGGALYSPKLDENAKKYGKFLHSAWDGFLGQPDGSLQEVLDSYWLADYYMIMTAGKLQGTPAEGAPRNRALWVQRFNEAAIDKYGDVDPDIALGVMADDLEEWSRLKTPTPALALYTELADGKPGLNLRHNPEVEQLKELRTALFSRMPELTEALTALDDRPRTMAEVRPILDQVFREMELREPGWKDWHTSNSPNGKNAATSVSEKTIDLPDGRKPFANNAELFATAFHEVYHALRGVNGQKVSKEFGEGLPGVFEFDEGTGVVVGYVAGGELPRGAQDHYVNIALASGKFNGLYLSREALIELNISRKETRSLAAGEQVEDRESLRQEAKSAVGRVFRGGDGLPVIEGGRIVNQPVNTIAKQYLGGFLRAVPYIVQKLNAGVSPEDLLDFLFVGSHDPTMPSHIQFMKDHGIKVI